MLSLLLLALLPGALADPAPGWLGKPWSVKELHCPFGCSEVMRKLHTEAKSKPVPFEADRYETPVMGSCLPPNTADWSGVKAVKITDYLKQWSNNEGTEGKAATRKNLARKLGIAAISRAKAGIVRCSTGEAFNFIYLSEKRAFILFEENAYWELGR